MPRLLFVVVAWSTLPRALPFSGLAMIALENPGALSRKGAMRPSRYQSNVPALSK
jgi:hypothetical protein